MRFWRFLVCFAVLSLSAPALAEDHPGGFKAWMDAFRHEAMTQHGISAATLDSVFPADFQPIPKIVELDRKQPEKTRTFEQYLANIVSNRRKDEVATKASDYHFMLKDIGDRYGVDPGFIVALWSAETHFGQNMGGYGVPRALATLAYDGRRSAYFRVELIKSLKILQEGNVKAKEFLGSWAGAMGQIQFMPSSFYLYAVDENEDGRRDIWGTKEDIFASAANYLSKSGWRKGEDWGLEVDVPHPFDRNYIGLDAARYSNAFWNRLGVRLKNGQSLPLNDLKGSIVQPDGPGTRAFVVYDNFRTILKWNRSVYFATSVGLLADAARTGAAHKETTALNR